MGHTTNLNYHEKKKITQTTDNGKQGRAAPEQHRIHLKVTRTYRFGVERDIQETRTNLTLSLFRLQAGEKSDEEATVTEVNNRRNLQE